MINCQINFAFPSSFGLSIIHNQNEVIKSTFYALVNSNLPLIQGVASSLTTQIINQLENYLNDAYYEFNLPYTLDGTLHQLNVWHVIRNIQPNKVCSYQDIAKQISSSPRAVGSACGKNPLPIIIPCHRVVKSDYTLGGFNGDSSLDNLAIKDWLLMHEGIELIHYQKSK